MPAAWSTRGTTTAVAPLPLRDWWTRFNDPLLTQLITDALRANLTLSSAQAALRAAAAERDLAAACLWPSLSAGATAQSGRSAGQSTSRSLTATLDATWIADVFGANRSAVRAAAATVEASRASLGAADVSVAATVGASYILLRSDQARLGIASRNLASEQETLQITEWREQAGLVTTLESAQARAAVAQTAALLPVLETRIGQTGHALAVLTGRPPAALAVQLAEVRSVPQAADEVELGVPADTLRRRADVRAAERTVASALARVSQADAARWPGFALSGSLGVAGTTIGALTRGTAAARSLLGSVGLPLFDGGARRAQVRIAEAAVDGARAVYVATVLAALADVEDTITALQGSRHRVAALTAAASAAAEAALLANQRYRSGLVDFQTVLDTQRTALGTQDALAGAEADASTAQVQLFAALGGGWSIGPDAAQSTGNGVRGPAP